MVCQWHLKKPSPQLPSNPKRTHRPKLHVATSGFDRDGVRGCRVILSNLAAKGCDAKP